MRRKRCAKRAGSLPRLQFLVDECCPLPLAERLRELGHDVFHALVENQGTSDEDQADLAFSTRRILVTADYDFGDLAMAQRKPFIALVIIAPRPTGLLAVAVELADQIHAMGDTLYGHLTLIGPKRVRR